MIDDEMIAVITAHKEKKQILFRIKGIGDTWHEDPNPSWDFFHNEYRVKPEEPKPIYRPYKNAKEFIADTRKHGGWLKEKTSNGYWQMSFLCDDTDYSSMLRDCVWADDGSPLGVKEE